MCVHVRVWMYTVWLYHSYHVHGVYFHPGTVHVHVATVFLSWSVVKGWMFFLSSHSSGCTYRSSAFLPFLPLQSSLLPPPSLLLLPPPSPHARSPSPEPIYSHDGKRLNTREVRVRKRLEDERHDLVQKAIQLNAEYKPPADYKWVCCHGNQSFYHTSYTSSLVGLSMSACVHMYTTRSCRSSGATGKLML